MLNIKLDTRINTTKVNQLISAVSDKINTDGYQPGDSLPSVNQLSKELAISRDTVFKAYSELKRRGLIESTPTKGYYVNNKQHSVFLFLDSFSPFKDVLYNTFVENLPANYKVDLGFHHYNYRIFETVILDSIGKYNLYIVMNFDNKKISDVLKKIDPNKLLILDWGEYKHENYAYVCQDFGEQPYQCLNEASEYLRKYTAFNFIYPKDSVHPLETYTYFVKFCKEQNIPHTFLSQINHDNVRQKEAFFVFRQKDIAKLLKIIKEKEFITGKDIGIVAYNDNPLYEVLEGGITTISTDFMQMGKKAAEFATTKEETREIIPTKLIMRKSL